jgi:proline iminopeptidase
MRLARLQPALSLALALGTACATKDAPPSADSAAPAAASATSSLPAGEGRLPVDGGSIWYKVSGDGEGTPVILLHGGPGFSSYYYKPLEALGNDRPVVRYDQLGGGKSTAVVDTSKINIPHFVRELDSLRAHLGYDRVHLVGHSWGTILGLEYYRAHPEHVASLTLASAALDIPEWERHAKHLVTTLSDSAQRAIKTREAEKKYDAPDYQAALAEFYGKYVWLKPVQADLDSTMTQMNSTIYNYMQGPSEFTIVGTLKKYDAKPYLKDVKVPTLFTVGDVDEANPATIRAHAALVPGAKVVVIPNAAHMTTWDNPAAMTSAVREHLRAADAKTLKD